MLRLILRAAAAAQGKTIAGSCLAAGGYLYRIKVLKHGVVRPAVLRRVLDNHGIAYAVPLIVRPPERTGGRGKHLRPRGHGNIQPPCAIEAVGMCVRDASTMYPAAEKAGLDAAAAVPVGDAAVILLVHREEPQAVVPAEYALPLLPGKSIELLGFGLLNGLLLRLRSRFFFRFFFRFGSRFLSRLGLFGGFLRLEGLLFGEGLRLNYLFRSDLFGKRRDRQQRDHHDHRHDKCKGSLTHAAHAFSPC